MSIDPITATVLAFSIVATPVNYQEVLAENGKNIFVNISEEQLRKEAVIETAIKEAKKEEVRLQKEHDAILNYTVRPLEFGAKVSDFGSRMHPIFHEVRMHNGTDYKQKTGASVMSVRRGKVIEAGKSGGLGERVVVEHANGIQTTYGHLSKILVKVGDIVASGDEIGKVGSTGNSTGPHLHFEVRIDDELVDSEAWLVENLSTESKDDNK